MWSLVLVLAACSPMVPPAAPAAPAARVVAPAGRAVSLDADEVGDLDGDGDVDIVTRGGVFKYNDGAGQFTDVIVPDYFPPTWGYDLADQTVLDLNGDGYDDPLAMYDGIYGFVFVYVEGGPSGAGATGAQFLSTAPAGSWMRPVGDTNGDGLEEVAMATTWPTPLWGFVDIAHTFSGYTRGEPGLAVPVGDVNGDGLDDIVMGAVPPYRGVIWQAGSASAPVPREGVSTFDPGYPDEDAAMIADWEWRGTGPDDAMMASPEHGVQAFGPGDIDGDGFADLVVVESAGATWLSWFAGGPTGFGAQPTGRLIASAADDLSGTVLDAADFDGDGVREVVVQATLTGHQRVLMFFEARPGDALPERIIDESFLPSQSIYDLVSPGDLDGDGVDDLLVNGWALFGEALSCPGPSAWYLDDDGDGFVSDAHVVWSCTAPAGASATPGGDCDDEDPAVYPGAVEYVGGNDLGCDGFVTCYTDVDHDGAGGQPRLFPWFSCDGQLPLSWTDCDDQEPAIRPGVSDVVGNDVDEDCDGALTCYRDDDGDGYGQIYTRTTGAGTCDDPAQLVSSNAFDCNDLNAALGHYVEVFRDSDGDGFGAMLPALTLCPGVPLTGNQTLVSGDCDDHDRYTWPGPAEVVGGGDENCDGYITCYRDHDYDGVGSSTTFSAHGSPTRGVYTCENTFAEAVSVDGDCDDDDSYVGAGGAGPWKYRDFDSDGWGAGVGGPGCNYPGWVLQDGDCAPSDRTIHPGAVEHIGDTDHNCDGLTSCYADLDNDGYGDGNAPHALIPGTDCVAAPFAAATHDDCDDTRDNAWYGHPEVLGDGVDNNCNGEFGPALRVVPHRQRGILTLRLTALDFPFLENMYFIASVRGPGAGPCPAMVADCAEVLSPRLLAHYRMPDGFALLEAQSPPVPMPPGTQVWLQVLSDTTHSPVVPYVIP